MKGQRLVQHTKSKRMSYIPLFLMLLPGLAYLIINNYLPMYGLTIAFRRLDYSKGILNSPIVGFENFEFLFKTKDAWIMIRNTVAYNVVFIFLGIVVAVSIALMMTEIGKMRIAKVIQPIICFPNMVSMVVISYLVYAFLGSNGFINNTVLSGESISWYKEAKYWPVILTIVHFWQVAGYSSIIYIATMSGIDSGLYEAARLDGASKWQQITQITLPLIRPTIILMLLMSVGRIFNSDFGLFLQVPMNSGMLYETTQTIDTYSYRALMQLNDVSKSSATGVFQSVIGFVLVMVSNLIVRHVDKDSALF